VLSPRINFSSDFARKYRTSSRTRPIDCKLDKFSNPDTIFFISSLVGLKLSDLAQTLPSSPAIAAFCVWSLFIKLFI